MIISDSTLFPIDKLHAVAVVVGVAVKPIPARLNVIEPDVVAIFINNSIGFNNFVGVLYFLNFFFDLLFLFLNYVISPLMLLM